nr:hypothetical protein [Bradyrhizobium nanningense]
MIREVSRCGAIYGDPLRRFEARTPPIAEAIALSAPIDYIADPQAIAYAQERLASTYGPRRCSGAGALCDAAAQPIRRAGDVPWVHWTLECTRRDRCARACPDRARQLHWAPRGEAARIELWEDAIVHLISIAAGEHL